MQTPLDYFSFLPSPLIHEALLLSLLGGFLDHSRNSGIIFAELDSGWARAKQYFRRLPHVRVHWRMQDCAGKEGL